MATPGFGAQGRPRPFKVVIDPGHGGGDQGAFQDVEGERISEKDLTLLLAEETAKHLKTHGITAILTRSKDESVPLGERTALANRLKADVFISIHMNSTETPMVSDAEGIESFILNNTSDATSRNLARLENTVLSAEEKAAAESPDVALILRDLKLDANLSESKRLACTVQTHLITAGKALHVKNRGVKQALFHVLLGAEMPSILVEAGFVSNPHDRQMVLDPKSRRVLGSAIARALVRFRDLRKTPQARLTLSRCKVH